MKTKILTIEIAPDEKHLRLYSMIIRNIQKTFTSKKANLKISEQEIYLILKSEFPKVGQKVKLRVNQFHYKILPFYGGTISNGHPAYYCIDINGGNINPFTDQYVPVKAELSKMQIWNQTNKVKTKHFQTRLSL